MRKLFSTAIAAAAIIASAAPASAVFLPVTFELNGVFVAYSNGAHVLPTILSLTGNFVFDPVNLTLNTINITESGPAPGPNVFNVPTGAASSLITGRSSLDGQTLIISFLKDLDSASDPLQAAVTMGPSGTFGTINVIGSADPVLAGATPIPPAVALFGTALALLAFVLYRRNPRMGTSFPSVQRFA